MTQSYRAFQLVASCKKNEHCRIWAVLFSVCEEKRNLFALGIKKVQIKGGKNMKKNYYAKVLALTVAASMVSVPAFAAEGTDDPQAQEKTVEQDE